MSVRMWNTFQETGLLAMICEFLRSFLLARLEKESLTTEVIFNIRPDVEHISGNWIARDDM